MNKQFLILLGIIFIAIFFRVNQLSTVPPSASLDEASIGWNAYSILNTGKDEYGYKFPLLLRAYDDWRPALYVYFVIPFVKLFGLNVLSVRLPSVILSTLSVIATYFLAKELFRNKNKENLFSGENIGLISSFFLGISPWHIYISRLGHEVNLGLSFLIFAVLFFLKKRIYLSSFFFFLSLISYQSEKVFIPILILGITNIYKSEILVIRKKLIMIFIFGIIAFLPFIKETLAPNALIRFQGTNVFNSHPERFEEQSKLLAKAVNQNDVLGIILYNRRLISIQIFLEGYLSHFNPVWLFTNSSGDYHKVPGIGLLYIWELPLILLGLYALLNKNFEKKTKKIILVWVLAAPIAASLATQAPHALRSFTFLPTLQILSALGVISLFSYFRNNRLRQVLFLSCAGITFLSISYSFRQYFYVFPKTQSSSFQYAISNAIPFALENKDSYKKIVFSNVDNLSQSYMFFLFYSSYDPKLYQKQKGTISGGYDKTHAFGKYEFRPIQIAKEEKGNLYIGNYSDFPISGSTLNVFEDLDGKKTIKVVTK